MTNDRAQILEQEQAIARGKSFKENSSLPVITLPEAQTRTDLASVLGLSFALGMIVFAIILGQSSASFFNLPALMIVLFGTMFATAVSFTVEEVGRAGHIIAQSMRRKTFDPTVMAHNLLDLAVVAKNKGILSLIQYEDELKKIPYLNHALQLAEDGYSPEDIDFLLSQDIYALIERHKRSASIALRASEVAPAMGLIGTLVGLVQMLADLENPETIGPAMAVALLTTFYGAIIGTVIMAPLAVKLEKNSRDETLIRTMIKMTAISIAKIENPRRLEMTLNAELPPAQRVWHFD